MEKGEKGEIHSNRSDVIRILYSVTEGKRGSVGRAPASVQAFYFLLILICSITAIYLYILKNEKRRKTKLKIAERERLPQIPSLTKAEKM